MKTNKKKSLWRIWNFACICELLKSQNEASFLIKFKHFSSASSVAVYLLVLHPLSLSGRLLLTSHPDKRSNIRSQSTLADRYSGRAGSGRSSPATSTPQWLFSDGASWHLNTPPPSPAHTEDGPEKKKITVNGSERNMLNIWYYKPSKICN